MTVHRLEVITTGAPAVLQRIIVVCSRRGCSITTMDWAQDGHRGHVDLQVTGVPRQLGQLVHWLEAVVDVLEVTATPAAAVTHTAAAAASAAHRGSYAPIVQGLRAEGRSTTLPRPTFDQGA